MSNEINAQITDTLGVGEVTLPLPSSQTASETVGDRVLETIRQLEALAAEQLAADDYDAPVPDCPFPDDLLLSIVVPVFNEESTVRQIVARLTQLPVPTELIIVDDYSTDGTRDLLEELQHLPNLKIIYKPQNEGKGAALQTGFAAAEGTHVIVQDADLEYDPRDIPKLLDPILKGEADVVYGSRFLQRRGVGSSWIHRFGNGLLTKASNLTTGLSLTDMETCYKLFPRKVLSEIQLRQNRFGFEPEVTAKLARRGHRFVELPVRYNSRDWDEGKKIGARDAVNALYCILRYAWRD